MKIDLYTKGVLTVIAVCLVWICVRNFPLVQPAEASNGDKEPPVVRIDATEPIPVAVYGYAGYDGWVRLKADDYDVASRSGQLIVSPK